MHGRKRKRVYKTKKRLQAIISVADNIMAFLNEGNIRNEQELEEQGLFEIDDETASINDASGIEIDTPLPELEILPSQLAEKCLESSTILFNKKQEFNELGIDIKLKSDIYESENLIRLCHRPSWAQAWTANLLKSYVPLIHLNASTEVKFLVCTLKDLFIDNQMSFSKICNHIKQVSPILYESREFQTVDQFFTYLQSVFIPLNLYEFYSCTICKSTCSVLYEEKCRNQLCDAGICIDKFHYVSLIEILQNWVRRKEFVATITRDYDNFKKRTKSSSLLNEKLGNHISLFDFVFTLNVDWLEFHEKYSMGGKLFNEKYNFIGVLFALHNLPSDLKISKKYIGILSLCKGPVSPTSIASHFEPLVEELLLLQKKISVRDCFDKIQSLSGTVANISADIPAVSKTFNIFSQSGHVSCRSCWAHWSKLIHEETGRKSFGEVSNIQTLCNGDSMIAEPKTKAVLIKGLMKILDAETKVEKRKISSSFGINTWSPLYKLSWVHVCIVLFCLLKDIA